MKIVIKGEFTRDEFLIALQQAVAALDDHGPYEKIKGVSIYLKPIGPDGKDAPKFSDTIKKRGEPPTPQTLTVEGYQAPRPIPPAPPTE